MGTTQNLQITGGDRSAPAAPMISGVDLDVFAKGDRPRVLIVDDDADTVMMLKMILRHAGFDVAGAGDHQSAFSQAAELNPDVILLDLMMPDVDGWGIYPMLKRVTNAPVIVISGSGNRDHAVKSLEMGADDFISKPFHNPEIVARINKVLLHGNGAGAARVRSFPGIDLQINYGSREIVLHGRMLRLVPSEFKLLAILAENAPHNVGYEMISKGLWGLDSAGNRSHIKNIIFSLRRKFEEVLGSSEIIVNYRSVGYQLDIKGGKTAGTS
jgi:DNA-binding response OmpR family regulator